MRTIKVLSALAVVASLFFTAPSHALLMNTEYIDFSGWDATQIDNGGGQLFTDVFSSLPGVDVFVQATGNFSRASKFQNGWIHDGLLNSNESDTFRFTFSSTVPDLVIKTATVDSQEAVDIMGVGPEMYFHDSGAVPTISPLGTSGITIVGTSTGQGATGASKGETTSLAQMGQPVIVRHRTLGNFRNKFEFFMVGRVVPEPNSFILIGFSLLGVLALRKRG
jgi:hypothetical protein